MVVENPSTATRAVRARRSPRAQKFQPSKLHKAIREANMPLYKVTDKSGRELEKLVARLESLLGNGEVEITSPDRIPDKDTGKLREVDVSLRAKAGSSNILVILECRRRTRKQDVTWIEQLADKQKGLGADKAVAVSSSGFSQNAIKKAKARGIDLRTIEEIRHADLADWFRPSAMVLYRLGALIKRANLNLGDERASDEEIQHLRLLIKEKLNPSAKLFTHKSTGAKHSLIEIGNLARFPGHIPAMGIPKDGTKVMRRIYLRFPSETDRYVLHAGNKAYDVFHFEIHAELWLQKIDEIPPSEMRSYKSAGEELAQIVEFRFEHAGTKTKVSFEHDVQTGAGTVHFDTIPDELER